MRACLVVMLIAVSAIARAGEAHVAYDLDVLVDTDARRVEGRAQITVENPTAQPIERVPLWRYPDRFATRSAALTDVNFYWVYPRSFNRGSLRVQSVSADGLPATALVRDHADAGPGTLLEVRLPRPLAPGGSVTLAVAYEVQVPTRYGPFGCFRGRCTLAGGFYPMVPALDERGFDLSAPPQRARYRLKVAVARPSDVIVNGELETLRKSDAIARDLGVQRAAALIVGPPAYRRYEETHRGVRIRVLWAGLRPVPSPSSHLLPYLPADRPGDVLDAVKDGLDLLAEAGVPMAAGTTLTLVEGALRIELAQSLPGFTLISDQIFAIFPLKRFLKVHAFELLRAVYEGWLYDRIAASERADDLGWAPQVGAAYLVDRYTLRTYAREEFAGQILSAAAFIPAIDRVIYAPQVPFASAYFSTLDDPDPLRDSLTEFANQRPRGKLVYAKLRDLLGDDKMEPLLRGQLDGKPLRALAEQLHGTNLDWFWAQWLRPYPKVDYRFGQIRSERAGDKWIHTVEIKKVTPDGGELPREPVQVRIRDGKGHRLVRTWDGRGTAGTLVFEMSAPISLIEIDPRGRLYQDLPGSNDDLRFDDRRPPRWKFIYNNFGGLVRVFPTFGLDLSLDFSLERILDLKNSLRFLVYHTDATQIGVSAGYTRSFGRKITQASTAWHAGASLGAGRIDPGFGVPAGAPQIGGTSIGVGASISYGDRFFAWEPTRSRGFSVGASTNVTVLDNGTTLATGVANAGWNHIVPIADGHGFAYTIGASVAFGDIRIPRQLVGIGGPGALRGYGVDVLLGRWGATTRIEYRHIFVHSLSWNLLNAVWVRGIGGGLFAEAGFVSSCASYAVDAKGVGADVGYTLRLFGDWFGVSQTTFNIDFAVPLFRNDRECFGNTISQAGRAPVGFFFAFGPPW